MKTKCEKMRIPIYSKPCGVGGVGGCDPPGGKIVVRRAARGG